MQTHLAEFLYTEEIFKVLSEGMDYYRGPSREGIISYIRHKYTNYEQFLYKLNTIDQIKKNEYCISIFHTQTYYYTKFKNTINNMILTQFRKFFEWYKQNYE